jgi:hypothetical protein
VSQRDVEAMHQEAKAGLAAVRSEVGQLRKTSDAAERLCSREAVVVLADHERWVETYRGTFRKLRVRIVLVHR